MDLKILIAMGLLAVVVVVCADDLTEKSDFSEGISDRSYQQQHHHPDPTYKGIWKKKFVWKARWVKTWQPKRVYVAVWKKLWGPVEVKEWVPIPKPPPGWIKPDVGPLIIKQWPYRG